MYPLAPSPPAVDDPAAPRLVLRDGTVASVRRSTPADCEAMRQFFHELSQESRRKRFFTAGEPPDALVDQLCDSADERRNVTLVAIRQVGDFARSMRGSKWDVPAEREPDSGHRARGH